MRKELNSLRIGLVNQHGRRFIVLEHQYGCRDIMCIRSIRGTLTVNTCEPLTHFSVNTRVVALEYI